MDNDKKKPDIYNNNNSDLNKEVVRLESSSYTSSA